MCTNGLRVNWDPPDDGHSEVDFGVATETGPLPDQLATPEHAGPKSGRLRCGEPSTGDAQHAFEGQSLAGDTRDAVKVLLLLLLC